MSFFLKRVLNVRCNKMIDLRLYNALNAGHFNNSIPERTVPSVLKHAKNYACCSSFRKYSNAALKVDNREQIVNQKEGNQTKQEIHSYFENCGYYQDTIAIPIKNKVNISDEVVEEIFNTDWSSANLTDLIAALKKLAYKQLNDDKSLPVERYDKIFDALKQKLPEFDNNNIETLLKYLHPLSIHVRHSDAYRSFVTRLDEECVKRFISKDIRKMLRMCDWFFALDLVKLKFVQFAITKIGAKPMQLAPEHFTQLLFYIGYARRSRVNMYEVEYTLEQRMCELSVNELGIILLGFFLTQTRFRNNNLCNDILRKTMSGLDNIEHIHLASIMKTIRYNINFKDTSVFRVFLSHIMPRIPELPLTSVVHILHATAKSCIFLKELMDPSIELFVKNLDTARIKDIERLIYCFDVLCPDTYHFIYEKIIKELDATYNTTRVEEIKRYPASLPRILDIAASKNIYSEKLLSFVMDEAYLKLLCPTGHASSLPREIWKLYWNLCVDLPNFQVPFIQPFSLEKLTKKHGSYTIYEEEGHYTKQLISEIVYLCKENLYLDVYVCQILPHYATSDIIIGIDKADSKTVPVAKIIPDISTDIKYVNTDNLKHINWFALCIIPVQHIVKGTDEPIGVIKARLRQLECVGYTPITIKDIDFNLMSSTRKTDYLESLILGENKI